MSDFSKSVAANFMTSIATQASWSRAWMRGPAVNCVSKKAFRGVNRLTLTLTAARNGWSGNRWGTDAQWLRRSFAVPRGTPATRILSMVEAGPEDTVCLQYGAKRITMVRPHDEYCGIQVGDDDTWTQTAPNLSGVIDLVAGAFGTGIRLSVPDLGSVKSNEIATGDERYASHLTRAALRLVIESHLLPLLPEEMTDPDVINLAAEIGTAFVLSDFGMVAERLRDQPTVRRWSAMLIGKPEVIVSAAGLAQHAIDRMREAGSMPVQVERQAKERTALAA